MREKFGKTYGFKDTSPYKGLIKERKVKAKKPHVQGETLALKIKDIIHEVITTAGNPVSFPFFHTSIRQKPAYRCFPYKKKQDWKKGRVIVVNRPFLTRTRGIWKVLSMAQ